MVIFFLPFLLSLPIFLWSSKGDDPIVIDYGKFQNRSDRFYYEENTWNLGSLSFNFAPEITPFFLQLRQQFQIDCAVETGTYIGGTSALFSLIFNEVHTIEVSSKTNDKAIEYLENCPNVQCHLGSSHEVLTELLPELKEKRLLFYLDAHWNSYWPLLDELEEIAKTHKDNCIIVIDDIKVPGRDDIPFDSYEEMECSYEYVKEKLDKVYTDYNILYIIPKSIQSRAKLIIIPTLWM